MSHYRATIRHGSRSQKYHVIDVEAASVAAALRVLAESFPAELDETADLVELRVQTPVDERAYTPE